jgi:hypothetical protein
MHLAIAESCATAIEGGLVIVEEGHGPMTRRWVRYVMPVMVEVDCGSDEITRVVTLPEGIREDRDDRGATKVGPTLGSVPPAPNWAVVPGQRRTRD